MLGIEYYGFALFVAVLICLIAILCKFLFADIKRQNKLLDEKESKLLKLYQSIEDVLEEFSDQAEEARAEVKKLVEEARADRAAALRIQAEASVAAEEASSAQETKSKPAQSKPKADAKQAEAASAPAAKKRPAKSGARAEGGASFQKIIDELEDDAEDTVRDEIRMPSRNEAILTLKAEGKSIPKIAQELGITQNEVKLVIGLNK